MAVVDSAQRVARERFRERASLLSERERNVLLMLAREATHREIALMFGVSEEEVFETAWSARAKLEGTF